MMSSHSTARYSYYRNRGHGASERAEGTLQARRKAPMASLQPFESPAHTARRTRAVHRTRPQHSQHRADGQDSDLHPADGPVTSVSQACMTCVPYHGHMRASGGPLGAPAATPGLAGPALCALELLSTSCFIRRNIRDIDRSLARLIRDRPVSATPP